MTQPWHAVIAATVDIAEQYMEAFNLSPEIWMPAAHAQAMTGRQFEHITVIRPHWRATPAELAFFDTEIVPRWKTRLSQTGKLKVI